MEGGLLGLVGGIIKLLILSMSAQICDLGLQITIFRVILFGFVNYFCIVHNRAE